MYSIRKWIFRPKRSDQSLLAGFFYADEELNMVATELDSFDGRKDPERCTALVNQLRMSQDKVLSYIERIIDECVPLERASRDFRVKFPDDVLQESLSGQLWFGAECLAAGSSIMNREVESASMRPLAKTLTRHLDYLRALLRDQCLRNINAYTDRIKESIILFDRLFAEFELSYVSAMVPVKTMKEYDVMQEVIVLFSETTQRALRLNLLTQDMIDDYDPALMFTIPRLAIVAGLLVYPEGPLNPDMDPVNMSEMFRPFQTLLYKIRELLWTLSKEELWLLEKSLCSAEEQGLYRDLEALSFPDDFDPYQDLTMEHADFTLDGAMGLPGLELDPDVVDTLLSVDQSKYGCMSQSPSTMTLVANTDMHVASEESGESEENGVTASCRRVHMAKQHITHQDSNDSGMLSENGSVLNASHPYGSERVGGSHVKEGGSGSTSGSREARSLRHSVSWPEATLRPRRRARYHNTDTNALGLLDDSDEREGEARSMCTHSHEFNFHLPLNTETSSSESPAPRPPWDRTPTNAVDLGSTRVFYTSDCCEEDQFFSSGTHISYVTETLNEVFVTDTSAFQQSFISAVTSKALTESMGICCKCGKKTCGATATGSRDQGAEDQGDRTNSERAHSHSVDEMNEFNMVSGDHVQNKDLGTGGGVTTEGEPADGSVTVTGDSAGDQDTATAQQCGGRDQSITLTRAATNGGTAQHGTGEQHGGDGGGGDQLLSEGREGDHETCPHQEAACLAPSAHTAESPLVSPTSSEEEKANVEPLEKEGEGGENVGSGKERTRQCRCSRLYVASCDTRQEAGGEADVMDSAPSLSEDDCGCLLGQCTKGEMALRSSLELPRVQRLRYADGPTMMCSSCNRSRRSSVTSAEVDWDRESYNSSETSSYNSDCHDDEEIALAIQAAELASRREARSRFKSSNDLIHRLFVCISGVADQLQTNYASDLRHILKAVFECNSSEPFLSLEGSDSGDEGSTTREEQLAGEQSGDSGSDNASQTEVHAANSGERSTSEEVDPPKWVPDDESPHCESCEALFTFVRRRHHCRNCGKIFCGRCSSNAVPLPHYGHTKPVRVCNHCFMFQVNPFTVDE